MSSVLDLAEIGVEPSVVTNKSRLRFQTPPSEGRITALGRMRKRLISLMLALIYQRRFQLLSSPSSSSYDGSIERRMRP